MKVLTRDKLALVLTGSEKDAAVRQALKSVGWVELRIDKFPEIQRSVLSFLRVARRPGLRVIGTVRWKRESGGGGLDITERQRLDIYREIMDYVDYIDVEIKSRIAAEVAAHAKSRGKKVILSYHDFKKTPSMKMLERICGEGRKLKPDIIKVAVRVNSPEELFELMSFTYYYSKKFSLVVAPMGTSLIERLMPLSLGSLFTYAAMDETTAPGQPSLDSLKRIFDIQSCKKI
jgi:3-dehydroquinate dehydratase I